MQSIVEFPGASFYFPFLTWTPSFLRRMLKQLGQYVQRSSWISLHLNTWMPGNILDDSPTIMQSQLPYQFTCVDSKVSSQGQSLGINSQPTGQKQWSYAWQMKHIFGLFKPYTKAFLALASLLCRLCDEFVLQKKQDLPLPPQILQSNLYHLIRVSFPVKQPKSTESIYQCRDLLLKSLILFRFSLLFVSVLFQLFSVSQAVFENFFLSPYSIEPFPIKLSFNIACSIQIGSLLPSPSFEN